MNTVKSRFLVVAMLIAAAIGFIGCSGNGAKPASIAITPTNPYISAATATTPFQFNVTETLSDGTTLPSWQLVTWSSSSTPVATISSTPGSIGLVTPNSALHDDSKDTVYYTIVKAIDNSNTMISATTTLYVVSSQITTIIANTTNTSISLGTKQTFTFTASWNSLGPDISNQVTWSSSNPGIATISNASGLKGVATPVSIGTTTIIATDPYSAITSTPGSALTVTY